jgi:hypothetical protein
VLALRIVATLSEIYIVEQKKRKKVILETLRDIEFLINVFIAPIPKLKRLNPRRRHLWIGLFLFGVQLSSRVRHVNASALECSCAFTPLAPTDYLSLKLAF